MFEESNASNYTTNGPLFGRFIISMKWQWATLYLTIYLSIWFVIVLSNSLVLLAFHLDQKLRRCPSNYFLVSLACADLLTGLIALPLNSAVRLVLSEATCYSSTRKYFFLPVIVFGGCSLLHLLLIAIDRYLAINIPLKYPVIITRKRVKMALALIWSICIGHLCFQVVIVISDKDKIRGTNICVDENYSNSQDTFYLYLAYCVVIYFILVGFCYLRIYAAIRKIGAGGHLTQVAAVAPLPGPEQVTRYRELRTTVTMGIVVGVCGVCWIPTSIKLFLEIYGDFGSHFALGVFSEIVLFANSMANPVIYGWRYPEFRSAYQKAMKVVYRKLRAQSTT